MKRYKQNLLSMIELFVDKCKSCLIIGEDGLLRYVDPIDGSEISAHYGSTHLATALLIYADIKSDQHIYALGEQLLVSILNRWDESIKLPAYHFDFNNFALCIACKYVKDEELKQRITNVVCKTSDSNHDTINWLPMRWYVNKERALWNYNTDKCNKIINSCKHKIQVATNNDGGIEDRLPHGKSYNLQYDLATVAVLQFLRVNGETIDLSKQLGFLLNAVSPDGDVNYLGRGTNQIFAWGLWIYLLSSSGQFSQLEKALEFIEPKVKKMLDENSLMLNEFEGKSKFLWWDYHYASVYTSHCLMWLILALKDVNKNKIVPEFSLNNETGITTIKSEKSFISLFAGRSEYLAESGPCIATIWTSKYGSICKGAFGPWYGHFGNNNIYETAVFRNYCGLISIKHNRDWSNNRVLDKISHFFRIRASYCQKPIFCPVSARCDEDVITIEWHNDTQKECILNFPSFVKINDLKLYVDGIDIDIFCIGSTNNQYGSSFLYQSKSCRGNNWRLLINC